MNQETHMICGICKSSSFEEKDKIQWIICESCGQRYHGDHLLANAKDGYCPTCLDPLLKDVEMEIYKLLGIVDGELQFQARNRTRMSSSIGFGRPFLIAFIVSLLYVIVQILTNLPLTS